MVAVEFSRMSEMSGKCICVWLVCEVWWVVERLRCDCLPGECIVVDVQINR